MTVQSVEPVFIVGAQRSGTTLFRNLLDLHPGLLVHPAETQFILALYRGYGTTIRNVQGAANMISQDPYHAPSVTPEDLQAAYDDADALSLREFLCRYLALWAGDALSTRPVVLKHPTLVFHLDLLLDLFPNLRVVHLVRDPRASVASQRVRWPQRKLWECAQGWRNAVEAGHAWGQRHPEAYLELQYEDIVTQPEASLRRCCEFLGVPFDIACFDFTRPVQTVDGKSADPGRRPPMPDPKRIHRWRQRLKPIEIDLVERSCARQMRHWGYEPSKPDVQIHRRIGRLLAERLTFALLTSKRALGRTVHRIVRRHRLADSIGKDQHE